MARHATGVILLPLAFLVSRHHPGEAEEGLVFKQQKINPKGQSNEEHLSKSGDKQEHLQWPAGLHFPPTRGQRESGGQWRAVLGSRQRCATARLNLMQILTGSQVLVL